jgi:hypothetical protein
MENVQCLNIAYYEGDRREEGDFLFVDVLKFLRLDENGPSKMVLGAVSFDRKIRKSIFWRMRRPEVAAGPYVPLYFKFVSDKPAKEISEIRDSLSEWLRLLDKLHKDDPKEGDFPDDARKVLNTMKERIENGIQNGGEDFGFEDLLKTEPQGAFSFEIENASDVVLTSFVWE